MDLGQLIALVGVGLTLVAQTGALVWFIGRQFAARDNRLSDAMTTLRREWQDELAEASARHAASINAHGSEVREVRERVTALRLETTERFAGIPSRGELVDLVKPILDRQEKQGEILTSIRDALVANGFMGPKRRTAHVDDGA